MSRGRRFTSFVISGVLIATQLGQPPVAQALRPEPDKAGVEATLTHPVAAGVKTGRPGRLGARAGLEETARVAALIRQHRLNDGLTGAESDVDVVTRFLDLLRQPPNLVGNLDGVPRSGPIGQMAFFSRQDVVGHPFEVGYLEEEWVPSLRKVVEAVAERVGVAPDDVGWPQLERFLRDLYWARGADGRLLMADDREEIFYRWVYREIPRLLIPRLAAVPIGREVVDNPFQRANEAGNDAVARAIATLLQSPERVFTDIPEELQADPGRVVPWVRLMLATNLVDASRPDIAEEIRQRGDLAQYVVDHMATPFVEALGGVRYLEMFLQRIRQPNTILVHFPDNNAELAASLKLAEILLSAYPTLTLIMVLKGDNGAMNDASVEDAERLLAQFPGLYAWLRHYREGSPPRFRIVRGPATHGMPLNLLPDEVIEALQPEGVVVLAEGEANVYVLTGLARELYLAWRLKWSEGVRTLVGLDTTALSDEAQRTQRPPAFIRLDGRRGPYYQDPFGPQRRTIVETLQAQAAGTEEISQRMDVAVRRLDGAVRALQNRGWFVSAEPVITAFRDHVVPLLKAQLAQASTPQDRRPWERRLMLVEDLAYFFEGLSDPQQRPLRLRGPVRVVRRYAGSKRALISMNVPGRQVLVELWVRSQAEAPLVRLTIQHRGRPRNTVVGRVTFGRDRSDGRIGKAPHVMHLDLADDAQEEAFGDLVAPREPWLHRYEPVGEAWGHPTDVEPLQPLRNFREMFQDRLIARLIQFRRYRLQSALQRHVDDSGLQISVPIVVAPEVVEAGLGPVLAWVNPESVTLWVSSRSRKERVGGLFRGDKGRRIKLVIRSERKTADDLWRETAKQLASLGVLDHVFFLTPDAASAALPSEGVVPFSVIPVSSAALIAAVQAGDADSVEAFLLQMASDRQVTFQSASEIREAMRQAVQLLQSA